MFYALCLAHWQVTESETLKIWRTSNMKKSIKLALVVMAAAILPLAIEGAGTQDTERKELINFIEYCKTCENLRQVNPAKDYTKSSLHELKTVARFYEDQEDFADCTDYPQQAEVNKIIGRTYNARMTYGR